MTETLKQKSLLNRLGENWHADNVYVPIISSVVPNTKHLMKIQDVLYTLYVDEHYSFKNCKNISKSTLYSDEVESAEFRMKQLDEEMKREGDTLEKLAKKFEELEPYLEHSSNYNDEDDEDDDDGNYVAQPKERGAKLQTKGKKMTPQEAAKILEEKRKTQQAKNTKSAMATSQEKLMTLQSEIEMLEKKIEYYRHYHSAQYGRQCHLKRLVLAYEKDMNLEALIKGLDDMTDYYEMIRRRYVPSGPCKGEYKELCQTHLLPLGPPILSEKGTVLREPDCPLHP